MSFKTYTRYARLAGYYFQENKHKSINRRILKSTRLCRKQFHCFHVRIPSYTGRRDSIHWKLFIVFGLKLLWTSQPQTRKKDDKFQPSSCVSLLTLNVIMNAKLPKHRLNNLFLCLINRNLFQPRNNTILSLMCKMRKFQLVPIV